MNYTHLIILITIIIYLLIVLLIGIYYTNKNKNVDDFYLGGRTLGPWVTAMSAEASDMSGWLLMGLPGLAYLTGIANAFWTAIGLAIGTYINWHFIAKRMRVYSQVLNVITIPHFFSKRYNDKRNILTVVSALIIIIFFIPYTAAGFVTCAKLFTTIFHINYTIALLLSAFIIVSYTVLGGFLAASTTDFVQSIAMTFALLFIIYFGITTLGDIQSIHQTMSGIEGYLSLSTVYTPTHLSSMKWIDIISMLAWGLGYFGMPHILLRFMAIESQDKIQLSRRIATSWAFVSLALAIFIGVIGFCFTSQGLLPMLEGATSETIIIQLTQLMSSHSYLFAMFAGVILAGILAATMSTADSQLLVASSAVSENIFKDFFHVKMDHKKAMAIARFTLLFISCFAFVLALNPNNKIFDIVSFAWAGFGASFGPIIVCALFDKKSNYYGAINSLIIGASIVIIWSLWLKPLGGIFNIYELLPAFIFALISNIVISRCTHQADSSILEDFDCYQQELHK